MWKRTNIKINYEVRVGYRILRGQGNGVGVLVGGGIKTKKKNASIKV